MEEESEMKESKFKRICVFCGSSPGNKSSYKDAAIELGNELVMSLSSHLSLTHTHMFVCILEFRPDKPYKIRL
jgi:hypothetical protein